MKEIKKFINSFKKMSQASYLILKYAIISASAILTLSLMFLITAGEFSYYTYDLYRISRELFNMPPGILFISGICAACFQDPVNR